MRGARFLRLTNRHSKRCFDITLIVDKGDTAISNGKIVSDTPGPGDGKHTLKFSPSPKMSSYLVVMLVGDFVCREGGADGIPIRVCSLPEQKGYDRVMRWKLRKIF